MTDTQFNKNSMPPIQKTKENLRIKTIAQAMLGEIETPEWMILNPMMKDSMLRVASNAEDGYAYLKMLEENIEATKIRSLNALLATSYPLDSWPASMQEKMAHEKKLLMEIIQDSEKDFMAQKPTV